MSTQHTPGPWEVAGDDKNGQAIVRAEHIEVATCWHHCVGSIEKQMRANARLIAAAPELLASLQEVTQLLDAVLGVSGGYPPGADGPAVKAKAAIARATGEQ